MFCLRLLLTYKYDWLSYDGIQKMERENLYQFNQKTFEVVFLSLSLGVTSLYLAFVGLGFLKFSLICWCTHVHLFCRGHIRSLKNEQTLL